MASVEDQLVPASSDVEAQGSNERGSSKKTWLAMATVLGAALLVAAMLGASHSKETSTFAMPAVQLDALPICETSFKPEWETKDGVDLEVQEASKKALFLLQKARSACEDGSEIPLQAADFGGEDPHYLHAQHKFASDCSGETYKLHYYLNGKDHEDRSFVLEVHRTFSSRAWTLLRSNPLPCDVMTQGSGAMEVLSGKDEWVKNCTDFAVRELAYQMQQGGCFGEEDEMKVAHVKRVKSQVIAGLAVHMVLLLDVIKNDITTQKVTELTVIERCNTKPYAKCVKQLSIDEGGACSALSGGIWTSHGADTVCRLSSDDKTFNGGGSTELKAAISTLPACKAACEDHQTCTGVEFDESRQRCELWTQTIGHAKPAHDSECLSYARQPATGSGDRKLVEVGFGHVPSDETEMLVARRQDTLQMEQDVTHGRRLQGQAGNRKAMVQRYITQGSVPSSFDPTGQGCFQKITVYDQGVCGSCYANAIGQMMGIRKCMLDNKTGQAPALSSRRLASEELPTKSSPLVVIPNITAKERRLGSAPTTVKGCKCLYPAWGMLGVQCDDYCCNPDGRQGLWCYVDKDSCGVEWDLCPSGAPQPPCADDPNWKVSDRGVGFEYLNCKWYAEHDPGCKNYGDWGQKTHCQKTCGTCPVSVEQQNAANPWYQAWYQYMPSVADIASCSPRTTGGHDVAGCDGGNNQMVWNDNLRHATRDLWIMGAACKPYDLKCFQTSKGEVVNPLTGGSCSAYTSYELWHKPCSCIPQNQRPNSYTCPSHPSSNCNFPIPHSMFLVRNVGNGLGVHEAVTNMQRHIAEFGPIYVSFLCKQEFLDWDWSSRSVYTGGTVDKGAHAVIAAGWGNDHGTDYWLLRNSWGSGYAFAGYFKFRRGVNLDKIEELESTASMVDSHFADYSAPDCQFKSWAPRWQVLQTSGKLCSYKILLNFVCSKAASLSVFVNFMGGRSGFPVADQVAAAVQKEIEVDMKTRRFGLQQGDAHIQVTATDATGNSAITDYTLQIMAAPGATQSAAFSDFDCARRFP